jgi:hypothetical protein
MGTATRIAPYSGVSSTPDRGKDFAGLRVDRVAELGDPTQAITDFAHTQGVEAARAQGMSPEERLRFHQEHSGPVMEKLHVWLDAQFDERRVEPNSGLGTAISYLLKYWDRLTLFLRQPGAPL